MYTKCSCRGRGRGWMASWQTVSDLLGPDAAYQGRNFYQQQHANGRGWWWDWPRSPAFNDLGVRAPWTDGGLLSLSVRHNDTGTHSQWVVWRWMYFFHAWGVILYKLTLRWGDPRECGRLSQHSHVECRPYCIFLCCGPPKKCPISWLY